MIKAAFGLLFSTMCSAARVKCGIQLDAKPVEDAKLNLILEDGRIAPTGCNYQPQRIFVIQSKEAMEKAISTKASLYGCPVALLVCYDKDTVWKNPADRLFGNYNCGEQDASIVAASMMFQAEELGVHSLWIRGFVAQAVIDAFALPNNIIPVMILALGYPSKSSHPAHLHKSAKTSRKR